MGLNYFDIVWPNIAVLPLDRFHISVSFADFFILGEQGCREQGWHSGESARLPPMCPGFDSRTRRHMWVQHKQKKKTQTKKSTSSNKKRTTQTKKSSQPRSQGPISSSLEKAPWLRLVKCQSVQIKSAPRVGI